MKKLTFLLFALFYVVSANAAYLKNVPVVLKQPDGTIIHCFITGDEFHRRVHDKDNYTIMQDPSTGYYVYAIREGVEIKPSLNVVGKSDPKISQLEPNIDIPAMKMEEKRSNSLKSAKITINPHTKGIFYNLVVFIRFADDEEFDENQENIKPLFNENLVGANSVYNYYKEASYQQLEVNSYFYPESGGTKVLSYRDKNVRNYYQQVSQSNPIGYIDDKDMNDREANLVDNVIKSIKDSISLTYNLDGNDDGYIDNICFLFKGTTECWGRLLWPHASSISNQEILINNKKALRYNFQFSELLKYDYLTLGGGVGVLCHELFHSMGAPDLYHYNNTNDKPVSVWDLMGDTFTKPQQISAYMKFRYGKWINEIPEITKEGIYYLKPLSSPRNNCYKIKSPNSANEYFVIEYRNQVNSFNNVINLSKGLIFYRINTLKDGMGNVTGPPDELYVYRPFGYLAEYGTITEAPFSENEGRTIFNDTSNPKCFLSDGQLGLINISDIGLAGDSISFKVNKAADNYLTLDYPVNPLLVKVGDTLEIKWKSFNIEKVNIDYSIDGGQGWVSIIKDLSTSSQIINQYFWEIPHQPTNQCKIKISNSLNANQKVESKYSISILTEQPPSITLIYPNGNESLELGSRKAITWESNKIEFINLLYSIDGGITWKLIKDSIPSIMNHYLWDVPGFISESCKIKAEDASYTYTFDQSDKVFSIISPSDPAISIAFPNGGEKLVQGSYQNILWQNKKTKLIKIEFSDNNGSTWETIVDSLDASKNSYGWEIPDIQSDICLIKISDVDNSANTDLSDSLFFITPQKNPPFWKKTNNFSGAQVQSIVINNREELIASCFRSFDGGESWERMNISEPSVKEFHVVYKHPSSGYLFAASTDGSGGVYRSINNGDNWEKAFPGIGPKAFTTDKSGNLLLIGWNGELYKSTNNGDSWNLITIIPNSGNTSCIAINSRNEMFVGSWQKGIFISRDDGNTWSNYDHLLTNMLTKVTAIIIDKEDVIYCGGDMFQGIAVSADNGYTWEIKNNGFECPGINIAALYIDSDGTLYAGSRHFGVYKSNDKGKSWKSLGGNSTELFSIVVDKYRNIFIGTRVGIKRLTYSDNIWEDKNNGLKGSYINKLLVDRDNDIFIGAQTGIYFSDDRGCNWQSRNNLTDQNDILTLFQTQNGIIFSTANSAGLNRTKDKGLNWEKILGVGNPEYFCEDSTTGVIYGANGFQLIRSSDEFKTAEVIINKNNTGECTFRCIAINKLGYVYVGTSIYSKDAGIYLSKDQGKTWSIIPGFEKANVRDIKIDSDGIIYVGIEGNRYSDKVGLYKSVNDGTSWEYCGPQAAWSVYEILFTKSKNTILISQPDGIKLSNDKGETWHEIEGIYNNSNNYSKITIDQNNYIYASTEQGDVYVSNYPINDLLNIPPRPKLLTPINQEFRGSFIWQKSKNAEKYNLQVSDNLNFKNPLYLDVLINDTVFLCNNLQKEKLYYWKVQAISSNFISLWSETGQFSTININTLDSLALVSLYNHTNGKNWINKSNWLKGRLNTWEGVQVENGRVTSLDLYSSGLNGTLPIELSNLTNLKFLSLSNNQLTGTIPSNWNNLSNLEYIYLNNNKLGGRLPENWGTLLNIRQIYLFDNLLEGQIPESWSNLKNLFAIYLGNNRLTGIIPSSWAYLTDLVGLGIENNSFTELPDFSANSNLNYLRIQNNLLDFDDIEPNIGVPNFEFFYSPQKKFGKEETYNKQPGETLILDAKIEGNNNLYQWYKNGNVLEGKTSSNLVFETLMVDDSGLYTCKVTNANVPNLTLESRAKKIIVVKENKIPIANAGVNQSVNEGVFVTLDGSTSSDGDNNPLTYFWTAPTGITLSSTTVAKPTFTAPEVAVNTNYVFTLVVNDGMTNSPADYVTVTVNQVNKAPIANAGSDQSVNEGTTVSLDGSASLDPDNTTLTYLWKAPAGIFLNSITAAKPTFTAPEVKKDSTLIFSLLVKDGVVNSLPSFVKVTVLNVTNVGVPTSESPFFKIFPNPTAGIVNLELMEANEKKTEVVVTNLLGAEICRKEVNNTDKIQIDLSNQKTGIYLLRVTFGNKQFISKVIVQKE